MFSSYGESSAFYTHLSYSQIQYNQYISTEIHCVLGFKTKAGYINIDNLRHNDPSDVISNLYFANTIEAILQQHLM